MHCCTYHQTITQIIRLVFAGTISCCCCSWIDRSRIKEKEKKQEAINQRDAIPFWDKSIAGGDGSESSVQLQPFSSYASYSRKCKSFAENCSLIAGGRQQSQLFQCRDLVGHIEGITAMEFSDDGSFLVSGCFDGAVRLWSIREDNDGTQLMETEHKSFVTSLAISSDNSRIFSTGRESAVFIYDTNT